MKQHPEVLVVGGGPVGLCAALVLARRGVDVTVIEEGWRPASHSYAVGLHPASLDLLAELALLPSLLSHGQRIDRIVLCEGASERAALELADLAWQHPYVLALPQSKLEERLVEALRHEGVAVHWNHRLATLVPGSGDSGPVATVERLDKEGSGYGYATQVWVVDATHELRPRFVIGADGHHSAVRRALGTPFDAHGAAHRVAAFELTLPGGSSARELRIGLGEGRVDVFWPLPGGRLRAGFELPDNALLAEGRWKDRGPWSAAFDGAEDLLNSLLADRAPWIAGDLRLGWAGMACFERRLARQWGRDGVWLAGDAAHLGAPQGVHSLNLGLLEAAGLARRIDAELHGGAPEPSLVEYEQHFRAEWQRLFRPPIPTTTDPWLRQHAYRLQEALPASGAALTTLLSRLGLGSLEAGLPVAIG